MKYLLGIFALVALAGCPTPTKQLEPTAANVAVESFPIRTNADCEWLGEVTGSEGHWYSYLFYPNDTLVEGALNELKNEASALGADTVLTIDKRYFQTSVTFSGSAYKCLK